MKMKTYDDSAKALRKLKELRDGTKVESMFMDVVRKELDSLYSQNENSLRAMAEGSEYVYFLRYGRETIIEFGHTPNPLMNRSWADLPDIIYIRQMGTQKRSVIAPTVVGVFQAR